jgi:hypothetical protein
MYPEEHPELLQSPLLVLGWLLAMQPRRSPSVTGGQLPTEKATHPEKLTIGVVGFLPWKLRTGPQ